jgi:hypothetical protein
MRQVLLKTKKVLFSNFSFPSNFSRKRKILVDIVNFLYACMFILPINHAHQLQLAAAIQENHFFPFTNCHFCDVYRIFVIGRIFGSIFLPNIRFRPKQENPFSVDHLWYWTQVLCSFVLGVRIILGIRVLFED